MTPPEIVVDSRPEAAGPRILEAIRDVIARRGRCRLGICGGSTPEPVFRWLAAAYGGDNVVLTWVDERHLPADHPDSNYRLARACGLTWDAVPMVHFGTLSESKESFERVFPGLDVAVLGVGSDGHIASLFPDHPALSARGACVAVFDSPKPPPQRLSLTLEALEDVDFAFLLARGMGKRDALRRSLYQGELPLGRYRPRGRYTWFIDPDAASGWYSAGATKDIP